MISHVLVLKRNPHQENMFPSIRRTCEHQARYARKYTFYLGSEHPVKRPDSFVYGVSTQPDQA